MVSARYARAAVQMALARASLQLSRASVQKAETKGGLSKCRGIFGSARLNRMQCQAPFPSMADSRKTRPRRMLSLPAPARARGEAVLTGADAGLGVKGRTGGAGSCIVFLRNSSEAAPVLAASRSASLSLLFGGSTTCVASWVFFVHLNLVVFGQRHAEFPFDRFPRFREKTFAKFTVFSGSRYEEFCRVNRFLHHGTRPPDLHVRIRRSAS